MFTKVPTGPKIIICLKRLLAALTLYNSKLFRPSKKQDAKMAACYCQVQVGGCFVHFGVRRRLGSALSSRLELEQEGKWQIKKCKGKTEVLIFDISGFVLIPVKNLFTFCHK